MNSLDVDRDVNIGGLKVMNKNMKLICNEIKQGVNLDFNLPQFFNRLVTLYEQYAEIKLTMHYYTFYESYLENSIDKSIGQDPLLSEVNNIMKDTILSEFSGDKLESGVKKLNSVRNKVMNQMKILTAYTDIFQIYEYVLNRTEYRFKEVPELKEEEFVVNVLQYIFDTKDNVIINDKIKEVIGQLPIRFTKSRYFDLIKDSISIYKGADCSALDTYIYMIKTSSMLYKPEGMDAIYPELLEFRKELEVLDYKNLTKEQYDLYSNKIEEIAIQINNTVDYYYGLQEIINHLYVMLLTTPYAYMEGGYRVASLEGEMKYLLLPKGQEGSVCLSILYDINEHFLDGNKNPLDKTTEDKLVITEGKQELLSGEFGALESILEDIRTNHSKMVDSLMLGRLFQSLNISQNLLGNSLFIELDGIENSNKADEDYVNKAVDNIITELLELFNNSSKYVTRAVMANTINKMPVFFQTTNDVAEYVSNSLDQCHDLAEKTACIHIIKSLMEN
jgi:hypothetical protein